MTGHRTNRPTLLALLLLALGVGALASGPALAAGGETPVERTYVTAPPAPYSQTKAEADAKSAGCMGCHTSVDNPSMHKASTVVLGCTDCHGGDASVRWTGGHVPQEAAYVAARDKAHVLPRYPQSWHWPSSANPVRSYSLLNKEAPEYVRFVNPSDYRVAREACGSCHMPIINAAERSLMATNSMFWGIATYNNGILPFKNYILGEAYTRDGQPATLKSPVFKETADTKRNGLMQATVPMPRWEIIPPADVFRVFERGGRNIVHLFPEIGNPNSVGNIQRLDEPGRPDVRAARAPACASRCRR